MSELELALVATPEAVDWVYSYLAQFGFDGQIVVCPSPAMRAMSPPGPLAIAPLDPAGSFQIRLYLPDTSRGQNQAMAIAQHLSALERTGLTSALQMAVLPAIPPPPPPTGYRVGQRWVIFPGGPAAVAPAVDPALEPNSSQILIRLDPGLSFGTGLHPATQLNLQLLERYVAPGMQTLDLGSGSGILSIAMASLGAKVVALDNDPQAIAATQATVELNRMTDWVTAQVSSLGQGSALGHWLGGEPAQPVATLAGPQPFNLIAANLLGRIQIALAPDYAQALGFIPESPPSPASVGARQPGGLLITSGYTRDYEADLNAALAAVGFEPIDRLAAQDWVAGVYRLDRRHL